MCHAGKQQKHNRAASARCCHVSLVLIIRRELWGFGVFRIVAVLHSLCKLTSSCLLVLRGDGARGIWGCASTPTWNLCTLIGQVAAAPAPFKNPTTSRNSDCRNISPQPQPGRTLFNALDLGVQRPLFDLDCPSFWVFASFSAGRLASHQAQARMDVNQVLEATLSPGKHHSFIYCFRCLDVDTDSPQMPQLVRMQSNSLHKQLKPTL